MNNLLDIIKQRRSIRSFKDTPILKEVIDKLADALIWAPSAGNLQSRKFYFVTDKKVKEQLVEAALGQSFIADAPLVVVGCADLGRVKGRYENRGTTLYAPQDVAASVQNLLLVAHEQGLGTVWVGAFDEDAVSQVMKLPDTLRPVTIVPVGYPAKTPKAPPRLSKEEVITSI
ncbi:MAG: nitroreductase family protein [Planctomycetes bacterium]|nr:nitroreductase family protein [Planctomycetota bacterium]